QLPVVAAKLIVFNRWTAGVGQFTETVRMLAPDQTTVLHKHEMRFELKAAVRNSTNLTIFTPVEFQPAGVYYMEILVDAVLKLRSPVIVKVVPPAGQAAPADPPAQAAGAS